MEPLKYMFNENVIDSIASSARNHYSDFSIKKFKGAVLDNDWEGRELKDRISFIAICLREFLPKDFKESCSVIEKMSLELPNGFEQMPLPTYVEFYGQDHFNISLNTLEKITQGSTGEFAIRPFLKSDSTATLKVMKSWAKHKNEHVRRLSSEGCRPRLPWGGNFNEGIKNPKPILEILELLKNDSSLYVRKSVGNNLNDISKDNSDIALEIGNRWIKEGHEHASWIVKKGLRGLLKEANTDALQLFGYGNPAKIHVEDFEILNDTIAIGDRLDFSLLLKNKGKEKQKLRLEYLIEYQKKNGSSIKVFQLSELELEGNTQKKFVKYQSFADMSTRKHFKGQHQLFIRVNGLIKASLKFNVLND